MNEDSAVRVVKGSLTAEELAALTAVLVARAAVASRAPARSIPIVRWRRLERSPSYSPPHSWHSAA
ncbi:acyl-CoA carboxylase epsilon subunit-like protein [Streptomyces sp. 846.5]|nr:acyl-CoA carboxylase epsilon subunit-like protein [Streptomyces sp. 846.5]